jgi:S-formylglutathione hydrolase FrmB
MGGYGALKLAMKYPEIYSTVYGMGSCCLRFNWVAEIQDPAWITALNLKESKQFSMAGFGPQSKIALSAAFSPNPSRPPFFVDFPFELVNGNGNRKLKPVEDVQDKWTTNSPLTMLKQYQSNLLKLGRIRFDVGNRDPNLAQSRDFSQALAAARIRHVFEEYNGNHINRIEERMENKVLPFLSNALNPQAKLSTMWGEIKKSIP